MPTSVVTMRVKAPGDRLFLSDMKHPRRTLGGFGSTSSQAACATRTSPHPGRTLARSYQ